MFSDSVSARLEKEIHNYLNHSHKGDPHVIFELVTMREAAKIREAFMHTERAGFDGVPDSLLRLERKLENGLVDANLMISQLSDPDTVVSSGLISLKKRKHDLEMALVKLKRIFEIYYPDYYSIKYGQKVYTLDEIMKRLQPDESILQYIASGGQYYLMLIRHHKTAMVKLGSQQEIDGLIASLLPLIRNYQPAVKRVDAAIEFNKWAYPLYNFLIGPVEKRINNSKLIIIPEDSLCYLPFGVLVSDPAELDFREMRLLIKDHAISYNFSPALWAEAAVINPQFVKGNLISFIDGQKDEARLQMINGAKVFHDSNNGRQEIREILNTTQGRYFDRTHATEKWFRQRAPDYRIIHIGLPSVIDANVPLQSMIRFNDAENDSLNDGKLYAWEFAGLRLYARLMILRNCSLLPAVSDQKPHLSPWQFSILKSGIPSVMLSLWPAHHEMSAEIIKGFYTALNQDMPKDAALQESMLTYLGKVNDVYAHPAFWSGFIFTGNTSPLDQPARPWYLYLLIIIPILFVTVWIVLGKKSSGLQLRF